ncbi:MAG: cytochrome c oxidase subunit II [Gemmatimonadales bacterium]
MHSKFPLFPEQASTLAAQVDLFYFFLIGVSLFFGTLIAVLLVAFAVRFRRRPGDATPKPIHGSTALELLWTIVPFGLAMIIFVWAAVLYFEMARPPDNAHEVFVVGKQWMWKLQHIEGRREINELHVPVGQAVKLTMTSEDVIHSFFVPAFRMKADVVPGRYTTTWFQATKVGEYHLFCSQYCGTEHSGMIGRIVVMEPADYQGWLSQSAPTTAAAVAPSGAPAAAQQASVSPAAAGEALFTQKACATCHQPQGGALGPSLLGIYGKPVKLQDGSEVVADDAYIRESILNPTAKIVAGFQPVMPTFQGQLDEEQIRQLIEYIKSLKPAGGAAAPGLADARPGAADPAS